ncbi:hypothetical protein [Pseudomonas sp.]|jgi:hypothetical protein|uniref:hypothetical protein n=1 Tax=Pseudomonas sp. TaxID=306 RepID=UPI0037CC5E7B
MITAQGRLLIALLGLCSALPTAAVQLPLSALAAGTPLTLPAAQPLKGLDDWRLHGLFRQPGGSGWALLSIPQSQNQRVERGALLRDGIRLASIENDGVWLQRGQQRAFLRLSGGMQLHMPPEPEKTRTPDAETSANCQQLVAGGVPLEELMTVGVCP